MKFHITKHDLHCHRAFEELMAVAESDIREAHGETFDRHTPSNATLSLYPDVVQQAETHADLQAAADVNENADEDQD